MTSNNIDQTRLTLTPQLQHDLYDRYYSEVLEDNDDEEYHVWLHETYRCRLMIGCKNTRSYLKFDTPRHKTLFLLTYMQ